MRFRTYQVDAAKTAVYPKPADGSDSRRAMELESGIYEALRFVPIAYCALGLAGEAGEVADEIKKSWRNDMTMTSERVGKVAEELGDVLWYVAQLSTELGLDMEAIAEANIEKLSKRAAKKELKNHE